MNAHALKRVALLFAPFPVVKAIEDADIAAEKARQARQQANQAERAVLEIANDAVGNKYHARNGVAQFAEA